MSLTPAKQRGESIRSHVSGSPNESIVPRPVNTLPNFETAFFVLVTNLMAQRVLEKDGRVVYEDPENHQINLSSGLSPVLSVDGKVALIRGRRFFYGDLFDCSHTETKNSITVYDPTTGLHLQRERRPSASYQNS